MTNTNPNLSPVQIHDLDAFEAVMGAVNKGVPLDEAVTLITGAPEQWDGLLDRVLHSFGDLEVQS